MAWKETVGLLSVFLIVTIVCGGKVETKEAGKDGRCPSRLMDKSMCPKDVKDQCKVDEDCSGQSKCCSTGCAMVCVAPMMSACELSRELTVRRQRSLGLQENEITAPKCSPLGNFNPVQCVGELCFCVDENTGYELPGTRARSLQFVNCSAPLPCARHQCRMLCPFEFKLDEEGCPLCECRDPCEDIQCPGNQKCSIEEAPCATEHCPPLPTCKQARSLSSLCPLGDPLTIDGSPERPFLCGNDPGEPTCPPLFTCHVNSGHDYGVCCAAVKQLVKPGTCPLAQAPTMDPSDPEEDAFRCGATCQHDIQCPSTQKCCISDVCGQHCVRPANLTACLQERMVSELLIANEREGRGYIPQCREDDGNYKPRQCSRNELVCWCVDIDGNKDPRSMGSADEVKCSDRQRTGAIQARKAPDEIDIQCQTACEYGYVVSSNGTPTCECDDPCENIKCPDNTTCVMTKDDECRNAVCFATPVCVRKSEEVVVLVVSSDQTAAPLDSGPLSTIAPFLCSNRGTPLAVGGSVSECSDDAPCPSDYECTPLSDSRDQRSVCCPVFNIIESTKEGQCPFIRKAEEDTCQESNTCKSDNECPGAMKCCVVPACGKPACIQPHEATNYSRESDFLQGPTMCEYLRDLAELEGVSLAIPLPKCDSNGAYEEVQCNDLGQCWCVDDFGSPIPGTKVSSRELTSCGKVREYLRCGDVFCRLGCDYGFVLDPDTGCPLCECRDPCKGVDCGSDHICQMVDIPCVDGVCPPVPQCVPVLHMDFNPLCPFGEPFILPGTNATLACSKRARGLECPEGYSCYSEENELDGFCCPTPATSEKNGQCPYLVPPSSSSCDLRCAEDSHCPGSEKCCSNGCGTKCIEPVVMTACQHQRTLLEHRAKEAGIDANEVYLPQCDDSGAFLATQCHPSALTCWCVDLQGLEIPGTRVNQPITPNCQQPIICPAMNCDLACLHGYQLDTSGCPVCKCRDPCEEVKCSSVLEECRIVHVACAGDPCPPLPVCLPKLENPCPTGFPLRVNDSIVECGPDGSVCPSSHKCHLSPLGEYALCCPKPREVCFERMNPGYCEGSIKRWHFNGDNNRCESFQYGGCGGNLNNFESEGECESTCPVLTTCERTRENNIRKAQKNKKITFIPKCNRDTRKWQPQQCLEELGVCWCVTPEGEQVPGTLSRGAPQCEATTRSARRMMIFDPTRPTNMICEPGQTVHVCNKDMCEHKICLSHPNAICRVNPCGGCTVEFVDEFNSPVNCEKGLTECQKELQKVLNSKSSVNILDKRNSLSGVLHDVDIYRKVDVYHSRPTSSLTDRLTRMGRKLDSQAMGELTVSGDVVIESQLHSKKKRNVFKDSNVQDILLTDATLTEPGDKVDHMRLLLEDEATDPELTTFDDSFNVFPTQELIPKPGTCPSLPVDLSLLNCLPVQECMLDVHCPGALKCCFNGCGAVCIEPEETPPSSHGMALHTPTCESDGKYSREQESLGLSWCVDSKGRPLHDTLTRGHVRCGPSGQILEQVSLGPVCSRGERPRVCKDECLKATCSAHPDAVCIADPCKDCRVTFYNGNGEKVHCDHKCSQPLASGMCRASFKKYFYNVTANKCQEFIYGGCQGNDNNFDTLEDCMKECQNTGDYMCHLPVQAGVCQGGEARWYYNDETRSCEPFLFTGCGGNSNNFRSKEECEARCPDLVLCPYWSASSMEPNPCSRSSICAEKICMGHPEGICTIDPCTCTHYFIDLQGQKTTCETPTESPKTRVAFSFEEESTGQREQASLNEYPEYVKSSESQSLKAKDPVTIILEGETTYTRCQLLKRHLEDNNSRRYVAQCDENGNFIPIQCYSVTESEDDDYQDCWCVDENGRKTQPAVYFKRGDKECEYVAVESVIVTLGFKGKDVGIKELAKHSRDEIKEQVHKILKQITAKTLEKEVGVVDLPDVTQVKFTLLGDNKIDVAYFLEDKVKKGDFSLLVNDQKISADQKASWFHHNLAESKQHIPPHLPSVDHPKVQMVGSAREVLSEAGVIEPPYLAITVIMTILSSMLVCGLIVAAVLYRRHTTGQYPKGPRGSMQSLAFSDSSLDRKSISSRLSESFASPSTKVPAAASTVENELQSQQRY